MFVISRAQFLLILRAAESFGLRDGLCDVQASPSGPGKCVPGTSDHKTSVDTHLLCEVTADASTPSNYPIREHMAIARLPGLPDRPLRLLDVGAGDGGVTGSCMRDRTRITQSDRATGPIIFRSCGHRGECVHVTKAQETRLPVL